MGCSDAQASETDAVVLPFSDLSPTPASSDPLASHRPAEVDCSGLDGWYLEEQELEVNSGNCNYLSVWGPATVAAPKGALLTTQLSYFDLTAAQPTEAHVALTLEDETLWEKHIPVPSDATVLDLQIVLPSPIQKGDRIGVHLHNHGQNTYRFTELLVSPILADNG
jgi:hypothetical protein